MRILVPHINTFPFSQDIIKPNAPLALRLSALLMVGVIRVHLKQTHYVYRKFPRPPQTIVALFIHASPHPSALFNYIIS